MGFKIKMAQVSSDDLQKIRDDRPTGIYDGPTPPPGVYDVKVTKVWFATTKTEKPVVKVAMTFDNEGENATYNGYSTIANYMVPTDPSQSAFPVQVSSLDSLFDALSDGKFSYRDFQEAATEGRTDADPAKSDKIGLPVTQIGSLRITGEQKIRVKTKIREYNGNEYVDIHYILREKASKKTAKPEEELDFGSDETDTDSDDSLDAFLED